MSTDQILKEALALPSSDKARIAEELLLSLRDPEQQAIDEAWREEVERRIDLVESGQMETEPVEDVIASLRQGRK